MGKKGGSSSQQNSSNPQWVDDSGEDLFDYAKNIFFKSPSEMAPKDGSNAFAGSSGGSRSTYKSGDEVSNNVRSALSSIPGYGISSDPTDYVLSGDFMKSYTPNSEGYGQMMDAYLLNGGGGGGATSTSPLNPEMGMDNLRDSGDFIANLDPLFGNAETEALRASGKNLGLNFFKPARGYVSDAAGYAKDATERFGQTYAADSLGFNEWDQGQTDKYMNPFIKTALESTSDEMNRQAQIEKLRNNSAQVSSGSFGGSRHGVVESGINRDLLDRTGDMFKTGMADAYQSALGAFGSDESRRLQTGMANEDNRFRAYDTNRTQFNTEQDRMLQSSSMLDKLAGTLGNLATSRSNIASQDIERLTKLGGIKTAQEQKHKDFPITVAQTLAGLLGGSPSAGSITTTQKQESSGAADAMGMVASIAPLIAMSDVRLKDNISKVGEKDGIDIVEWNYKGSPARYRGVLADQVKEVRPDAVIRREDGYLAVNYDAIGIPFEGLTHGAT